VGGTRPRGRLNAHQLSGRWGFKEIHYGIRVETFYFLKELFPSASFVFIVRNPVHQISSKIALGWWPVDSFDENVTIWRLQTSNFKKFCLEFPAHCHFLRYEDIATNPALTKDLFCKLGLPFTERQRQILTGKKAGATKRKHVLSEAQSNMILRDYALADVYSRLEIESALVQNQQETPN